MITNINKMVISWLTLSMSSPIKKFVMWMELAFDIWSDLLQEELQTYRQVDSTVFQYYTCLQILWEELSLYRMFLVCTWKFRNNMMMKLLLNFFVAIMANTLKSTLKLCSWSLCLFWWKFFLWFSNIIVDYKNYWNYQWIITEGVWSIGNTRLLRNLPSEYRMGSCWRAMVVDNGLRNLSMDISATNTIGKSHQKLISLLPDFHFPEILFPNLP